MEIKGKEYVIEDETSVVTTRKGIRLFVMENFNFSPFDRMHILTAVSELSRNMYKYAKTGRVLVNILNKGSNGNKGIKITFKDNGPGIPDIEKAMKPKPFTKYSTGMGIGLSGSKALADQFFIKSDRDNGTMIIWIMWEK